MVVKFKKIKVTAKNIFVLSDISSTKKVNVLKLLPYLCFNIIVLVLVGIGLSSVKILQSKYSIFLSTNKIVKILFVFLFYIDLEIIGSHTTILTY